MKKALLCLLFVMATSSAASSMAWWGWGSNCCYNRCEKPCCVKKSCGWNRSCCSRRNCCGWNRSCCPRRNCCGWNRYYNDDVVVDKEVKADIVVE